MERNSTSVTSANFQPLKQPILEFIYWYTVVKIRKKCDLYLSNSVGTLSCQSQDTQQFALLRQKCFGINRYWSRDNIVYQRGKRTNARMYRVGNMCAKCALLSQRLNLKWIQVEFICSMCIYTEMDWNMWRGFDSRYMFYVIRVWQLHSGAEEEKVGICLSHDNLWSERSDQDSESRNSFLNKFTNI